MRIEVERLMVPAELRASFGYLNPDYTTARYPDAANGVPFEVCDRVTAESKIETVEAGSGSQGRSVPSLQRFAYVPRRA